MVTLTGVSGRARMEIWRKKTEIPQQPVLLAHPR